MNTLAICKQYNVRAHGARDTRVRGRSLRVSPLDRILGEVPMLFLGRVFSVQINESLLCS